MGACLINSESFENVKKLLTGKNEIIVVSAIKGITTQLQQILDAAKTNQHYLAELKKIKDHHNHVADSLLASEQSKKFHIELSIDINDIENILRTVSLVKEYSIEIQDLILGYGEQWCAKLLTQYLAHNHKAIYLDASTVLYIQQLNNGTINVHWSESQVALDRFLQQKKFDQLVITGFIAATLEGRRRP